MKHKNALIKKQAEIREERHRRSLEKSLGEQSIQKISQFFSTNYNIDVSLCNAFEESLLKLAGVEEKPISCTYHYTSSLSPSALQPTHTMANSIFFLLGLSQPESLQRLMQYGIENKLDPFDYSANLSENNNKYLIRMNSQQLINVVLPQIQTYLNDNVSEIIRYHRKMDKQKPIFSFFTPSLPSDSKKETNIPTKNTM